MKSISRREFCLASSAFLLSAGLGKGAASAPLIESIRKETVFRNRDGSAGVTWFHPRACRIPGKGNAADRILMTLQSINGSDYFGPVHWMDTSDLGKSWTQPEEIPALAWHEMAPEHNGLKAGVCDVVPEWHERTQTVLDYCGRMATKARS